MPFRRQLTAVAAASVLLLAASGTADAARIRYRYAPDPAGGCYPQLGGGERLTLRGWQPYDCPPPRATCLVTFCHPCTGQMIVVPLALPESTPRMEYTNRRTIYNYGSDTVEVVFLSDGTVYVVYNSGLLRAP